MPDSALRISCLTQLWPRNGRMKEIGQLGTSLAKPDLVDSNEYMPSLRVLSSRIFGDFSIFLFFLGQYRSQLASVSSEFSRKDKFPDHVSAPLRG